MKTLFTIVSTSYFTLFLLLIGCASVPLTLEEQYAREDALTVEIEIFWAAYDNCLAKHGTVFIDSHTGMIRSSMVRNRPRLSIWQMRSASCSL